MQAELCALIVDDEKDIRTLVGMTLERMGLKCIQAATLKEAYSALEQQSFHFCITDMKLPDGDGISLIQHCNRQYSEMPIALITAFGNMEVGVNALKAGAFDVVAKPIDTQRLRSLASAALRLSKVGGILPDQCITMLSGSSELMTTLRKRVSKVARTQAPVFIQGPAGVGKEAIARTIHLQGSRSNGPFIHVNCQAVGQALAESVIFGDHEAQRVAAITEANNGTLYLSHIETLPSDVQARLLIAIQEKAGNPHNAASHTDIYSDFRLITSCDFEPIQAINNGTLRQDLYYRLNVVNLVIPPLSERREDILELTKQFIFKYANEWSMPEVTLSEEAMAYLNNHPFHGNVRELENMIQHAFTMMESEVIQIDDLSTGQPQIEPTIMTSNNTDIRNLENYLENLERHAIEDALTATRWNKTAAAERLGISFRALRYRCKKLGI